VPPPPPGAGVGAVSGGRPPPPFHVNYQRFCGLDVKAEVHDVAVLDHVLLALDA